MASKRYSVLKLAKGLDEDEGQCKRDSSKDSRGVPGAAGLPVFKEDKAWTETAKALFVQYDSNGDGCIDEDELSVLLAAISGKFSKEDVRTLLREADTDGNGRIEFGEFLDWLTEPSFSSMSRGRAIVENTDALEVFFNVYDKEHSKTISSKHFEECHMILQSALRHDGDDDSDDDDLRDCEMDQDREEALEFIEGHEKDGRVGFLDFVDWMRQHIPPGMSKEDFYSFAQCLAVKLEEAFGKKACSDSSYSMLGQEVMDHVREKFKSCLPTLKTRSKRRASTNFKPSPWDFLPEGLSINNLKGKHMMVYPIQNMRAVKDISWELLIIPAGSAGSEVWVAEVVRRLLQVNGKLKVDHAEYYKFDTTNDEWVHADKGAMKPTFDCIQPGLGVFCLLKTVANFGSRLAWSQVKTALEGGVDMRLLDADAVDFFDKEIMQVVLEQMEEDGYLSKCKGRADKEAFVRRYMDNELEMHPGMVMATLLKLELVTRDPAWEDFVDA